MSKIFFIMGKSSTGKDTIYKNLIKDKNLNLKTIVSYTTRPLREGEQNGREYYFVSEKEMFDFEKKGKVIERRTYNTICGEWHYFLVDNEHININDNNYLLIGTLESYRKVRDYFGKENVIPIYIETKDCERLERAISREKTQKNPNYEELCRRYISDQKDFSEELIKELNITKRYKNSSLNECTKEITKDIGLYIY